MRSVKYILLLICSIAALGSVAAAVDSLALQARLDKKSGVVGELLTLNLLVKGEGIDSVSWEHVAVAFSEQVILQKQALKVSDQDFAYQVTFTSARDGKVALKPIEVYAYTGTIRNVLHSDSIKVAFTAEKLIGTLHDIQPVQKSSSFNAAVLKAVAAFLGILALLLGVWWLVKYKFLKRSHANPQTSSTYSLGQIGELENQFQKGMKSGKLVSYEAAEVLKEYFKTRYGIDDAFTTTAGLKSALKAANFDAEQIQVVTVVRNELERVRFSHHADNASFYTSLLARIKGCILFHPEAINKVH